MELVHPRIKALLVPARGAVRKVVVRGLIKHYAPRSVQPGERHPYVIGILGDPIAKAQPVRSSPAKLRNLIAPGRCHLPSPLSPIRRTTPPSDATKSHRTM